MTNKQQANQEAFDNANEDIISWLQANYSEKLYTHPVYQCPAILVVDLEEIFGEDFEVFLYQEYDRDHICIGTDCVYESV